MFGTCSEINRIMKRDPNFDTTRTKILLMKDDDRKILSLSLNVGTSTFPILTWTCFMLYDLSPAVLSVLALTYPCSVPLLAAGNKAVCPFPPLAKVADTTGLWAQGDILRCALAHLHLNVNGLSALLATVP